MRKKALEWMKILLGNADVSAQAGDVVAAVKEADEAVLETGDDQSLLDHITTLWGIDAIKDAFEASHVLKDESTIRLIRQIPTVCGSSYSPSDDDILRFRSPTTDIAEIEYEVNPQLKFRFIDIGGQRKERLKWNTVTDLTAVIFVVALDEYDKTLVEDASRNRMKESLLLFRMIATKHFSDMPLILLLNKKDLFQQKIVNVDLNVCFPEYTGGCEYGAAVQFIEDEFRKVAGAGREGIYVHRTCATETNQMAKLFSSVEDIVLEMNLQQNF